MINYKNTKKAKRYHLDSLNNNVDVYCRIQPYQIALQLNKMEIKKSIR